MHYTEKTLYVSISFIFLTANAMFHEPNQEKKIETEGHEKKIVSCSKEEWKRIERLISELDCIQPQIALASLNRLDPESVLASTKVTD